MLTSYWDLLAKHHTCSLCDTLLLWAVNVRLWTYPAGLSCSLCTSTRNSKDVFILTGYRKVLMLFRFSVRLLNWLCHRKVQSPFLNSLQKNLPFSSFYEQTPGLAGTACVFWWPFSILETLKHPLFAWKRIITSPMKCWWAKWARPYLLCGEGSLESQSRWRVVWGGKHLLSVWGMSVLLRSLLFTHPQIIFGS